MGRALRQIIEQISLRLLIAVVTFIICLYIFAVFLHEIFLEKEDELDRAVFRFLDQNTSPELNNLMLFFSFFGKPEFLIPAYVILIAFFLFRKKKAYAIQVFVLAVSSTTLLFALKAFFKRDRPEIPIFAHLPGYSFPSGHALLGFVFFSILIYMVWKGGLSAGWKWFIMILLLLFSLFVGISRIILKVHFTSDVIAGFCLGYVWVLTYLWALNRRKKRRQLKNINGDV